MINKAIDFYKNFIIAASNLGIIDDKEKYINLDIPLPLLERFERIGCHDFLKDMDDIETFKFKNEQENFNNAIKSWFINNKLEKVLFYESDDKSTKKFIDKNLNISMEHNNIKWKNIKANPFNDILSKFIHNNYDIYKNRYNQKNIDFQTLGDKQTLSIFSDIFDERVGDNYFNDMYLDYKEKNIFLLKQIHNSILLENDKEKIIRFLNDLTLFYENIFELNNTDWVKLMIKHHEAIEIIKNNKIFITDYDYYSNVLYEFYHRSDNTYFQKCIISSKYFFNVLLMIFKDDKFIQNYVIIERLFCLLECLIMKYICIKIKKFRNIYGNFLINGFEFNKLDVYRANISFPYIGDLDIRILYECYLINNNETIKLNINSLDVLGKLQLVSYL